MPDVTAVYFGDASGDPNAHPVHRNWLRSVGADELVVTTTPALGPLEGTVIRNLLFNVDVPAKLDADVVVFESAQSLYCAPAVHRRVPDATLLVIEAGWHTVGPPAYNFATLPAHQRPVYYADRWLGARITRSLYRRYLDGVITVSEMMAEHVESFADVPTRIVRPTIDNDLADRLDAVDTALDSTTAVFVGTGRDHKGADRLVEAWPRVRSEIPDATLQVVGADHPASYGRQPGVTVRGYVEDLPSVFETAALQVHPARFDPSPVSTLEGMRAGVPPVVSPRTGTRSEARRIDSSLVVPGTPDTIADRVVSYFQSSMATRESYSWAARDIGREFEAASNRETFRRRFDSLL